MVGKLYVYVRPRRCNVDIILIPSIIIVRVAIILQVLYATMLCAADVNVPLVYSASPCNVDMAYNM